MQEVCRKAGLSPGTVYHYFKSKDDIIEHVAEREVGRAREFALRLDAAPTLEDGFDEVVDGILGSDEYADGFQVYMEIVCEAGRNSKVGRTLLKAEEIVLKAIRRKLKRESLEVPDVSREVLAEFLGSQLEMLELYKRYDPPAKRCMQMGAVCKKVLALLLRSESQQ